ncbi:hypothetical protein PORCAN_1469 [Porphyromonas crevioricanis JCM 13913]|nr:hypothetical protein PORCAN_1469 [Porphyromonas crevioricanis JCM 13913]
MIKGAIRYDFRAFVLSEQWSPWKPIHSMCGLLLLGYLRNLSDESVVEQWSEKA